MYIVQPEQQQQGRFAEQSLLVEATNVQGAFQSWGFSVRYPPTLFSVTTEYYQPPAEVKASQCR